MNDSSRILQGRDGKAIVAVDLVNDFITGVFGSAGAREVADRAACVLKKVQGKVEMIFTTDSHIREDPEFRIWGEHCVQGTSGAEPYQGLEGIEGIRVRKRHFDSFHDSDLDGLLRARNITDLYILGISTDICVLHTAAGAFYRYYNIIVVEDLCAAIDAKQHERALDDMKRNYGVRVIKSEQLIREVS